jgi:hypothetical protein
VREHGRSLVASPLDDRGPRAVSAAAAAEQRRPDSSSGSGSSSTMVEEGTVVLLRDVPVLSSFIAEMPYLQVKKNVHRLPIPIHTATRQGVSRPGRREGYLAACRGCGCWRGPGTSTRL